MNKFDDFEILFFNKIFLSLLLANFIFYKFSSLVLNLMKMHKRLSITPRNRYETLDYANQT